MTSIPPVSTFSFFSSKTIWGIITALLGILSSPDVLNLLGSVLGADKAAVVSKIITAIGAALAAFGIRTAIAKNGTGA